ncbi:hypothetical protein K474DRAFT_1707403 [Panus rudis PR-1116 ss-1]|nr:hypothetical protein K474DRAFT_1707403 [Panus rudis PR-1116 ss-1]
MQSVHRPNLKVDVGGSRAAPPPSSYFPVTGGTDAYSQSNISIFRSSELEIHIHSPSVKAVDPREYGSSRSLPVFGDHDKIQGSVFLDPKFSTSPSRLTVSLEGAFAYISPFSHDQDDSEPHSSRDHRYLFFTSTVVFSCGDHSPRSATSLREAFNLRSRRMDRRPSLQDIKNQGQRQAYPFSFELPQPNRPGEEIPPTFSSVKLGVADTRGRACVERAEVEYKVIATWESADLNEHARLDAPILFQPDTDFQSLDGLSVDPETWLEIPVRCDRPLPFKCAITLPVPSTFPRSSSIPYFVVFMTKPRSPMLAREIAVDATISVSLLRQVSIMGARPSPSPTHSPTISLSSSTNSDDSDGSTSTRRRLLRRVARSTPAESLRRRPHNLSVPRDKPLPELPPKPGVSETRTLHTEMSIGFPKRPRSRLDPNQSHPSLDANNTLPDGLYKGSMRLDKTMLPTILWSGLSVKYFLEVSVLFGQDELRARIPVRIF